MGRMEAQPLAEVPEFFTSSGSVQEQVSDNFKCITNKAPFANHMLQICFFTSNSDNL